MKQRKCWILIVGLAILAVVIHVFSSSSTRVEQYYSTGIYPYVSVLLWYLFGWLPFSMGDILYGAIVIWLLVKIFKALRALFRKQLFSNRVIPVLQSLTIRLLLIYIIFNILWGINYNRKGIADQLQLSMQKYSLGDLKMLNGMLLQKVNTSKGLMLQEQLAPMSNKEIFNKSLDAYKELSKQYAFLNYRPAAIKASMWGWLGNYTGFMGYYNPFTGEGQVNTTIPKFLQPYTNCHEIAHQLGYAKENEANFVGYLAAAASKDESFHYSVYLDLFLYANRNLFDIDSASATSIARELHPGVKRDLKEYRAFVLSHKNPVEPVIRWIYGKYLQSNQQPSGVLSYDEVTGFVIAYFKKYGKV